MRAQESKRKVGVFCGSRDSADSRYADAAAELGCSLADRGVGLVYGGSAAGLMGVLANAALERGGSVLGVIPTFLVKREIAHSGLTELRTVETLEERKLVMLERSDAFIVLPGGFGTLDEAFEVLCLAQLGFHSKPCVLLNVGRFFHHLIEFLDHATDGGFISTFNRSLVTEVTSVAEALACISSTWRENIDTDRSPRGRSVTTTKSLGK